MRSRWRAPLITLTVIVVIAVLAMHFLSQGALRDTLMSLHGGHRGSH